MSQKKLRFVSVLFTLFLIIPLVVFGLQTETVRANSHQKLEVAMLIPGQIDDGGFMEAGYDGLMKIKNELKAEVEYIDKVKPELELLTSALRELAKNKPDLIIAHGGQNSEAAKVVAEEFPELKFVVVQGDVTAENLASYEVLQEESAWLAGAAAGMLTETNTVGHISGIRVTPGLKGRAAFADGLNYTNSEANYLTTFSGDQDDVQLNKKVAQAEIDAGADIIFTMLNAGRAGATEAIAENEGVYEIGNVKDWTKTNPDVFIGSALANVSIPSYQAVKDLKEGNWEPQVVKIGLENPEAVDLALREDVSQNVKDKVDELAEMIINGEIEVKTTYQGEEFEFNN